MELSVFGVVAAVTVSAALPLTPFIDAVIAAVPAATAVTMPEALTVATAVFELLQVAVKLTSPDDPSLYAATALNCAALPATALPPAGVTEMEATDLLGGVGLTGDVLDEEQPVTARTKTRENKTHNNNALFDKENKRTGYSWIVLSQVEP